MPALYALLVGINDYPHPQMRLSGCVNDRDAVHRFLSRYAFAQEMDFHDLLLTDQDAKREGVIRGFQHFQQAGPGDLCVFYFSGHGSQALVPPEFYHLDPDHKCETAVCWDSRLPGGQDLTDKEISQLIFDHVEPAADIHFLALFDSCHSGSVSRNTEEVPRMTSQHEKPVRLDSLYGIERFTRDRGFYTPRSARHVLLSAARSYESAWETSFNSGGQRIRRGAFTYSLLQVLENSNLDGMRYEELHARIAANVATVLSNPQHPQLEYVSEQVREQDRLLFGRAKQGVPRHYVYFHGEADSWQMDLGAIHGIRQGDQLALTGAGDVQQATARQVYPGYAEVELDGQPDPAKSYYLADAFAHLKAVSITVAPRERERTAEEQTMLDRLIAAVQEHDSPHLAYSGDPEQANYLLDVQHGLLLLFPLGSDRPAFKGSELQGQEPEAAIEHFLANVDKVASWEYLWNLGNPRSTLDPHRELEVELMEYTDYPSAGQVDQGTVRNKDPFGEVSTFSYFYKNGEWHNPCIGLSVSRKRDGQYTGPLWVAGLFFNEQYGIHDIFLPVREIQRGDAPYQMSFTANGVQYFQLWLNVPDTLYEEWGETEVLNRMKILVSTTPFKTDAFVQSDLELQRAERFRGETSRAMGGPANLPPVDTASTWAALDVTFRIHRPMDGKPLAEGTTELGQAALTAPRGFQAQSVRLTSATTANRAILDGTTTETPAGGSERAASRSVADALVAPPTLPGLLEPANLASSRSVGESLNVLEFHGAQGLDQVSADHPIRLELPRTSAEEAFLPLGYDAEAGLFVPLGHTDAAGVVHINKMPEEGESTARGLGRSLKIYVQRMLRIRTGREDHYPILAAVTDDTGEEAEAVTDIGTIRLQVGQADAVWVVVHGIIGDNSDKAFIAARVRKQQAGQGVAEAEQLRPLVLTFDYDSLSIPIEQTARDLKRKLQEAGITEANRDKVTLIAHSMGGLVSRWMLEKESGHELVGRFVQVGSPNSGSPWANVYDMSMFALGKLINFLPLPGLLQEVLGGIGKIWDQVEVTVEQLQPDSEFVKNLQSPESRAPVPYYIVPGDDARMHSLEDGKKGWFARLVAGATQKATDKLASRLFKDQPNDDIVAVSSMQAVPKSPGPVHLAPPVGCDHFSYFIHPDGIAQLTGILSGEYDNA